MKRVMLGMSRTKYGRKGHLRIGYLNVYWNIGAPPWAIYWKQILQVKRLKTGIRCSLHYKDKFAWNLRVQWHPVTGGPLVRKWLECPQCGYENEPRNFYRRVAPENRT